MALLWAVGSFCSAMLRFYAPCFFSGRGKKNIRNRVSISWYFLLTIDLDAVRGKQIVASCVRKRNGSVSLWRERIAGLITRPFIWTEGSWLDFIDFRLCCWWVMTNVFRLSLWLEMDGLLCICAWFLGLAALAEVYACIKYRFTSGISADKMERKCVPKHCAKER